MVSLLLVCVVDTHGIPDVFVAQLDVIVKVPTIIRQFLSLEFHYVSTDFVEKAAIVRNDEERMFVCYQIFLKPKNRLEIQMISWFVAKPLRAVVGESISKNHHCKHSHQITTYSINKSGSMKRAAANAVRILHPPLRADIGPACMASVNCKPDRIMAARASAESADRTCKRA